MTLGDVLFNPDSIFLGGEPNDDDNDSSTLVDLLEDTPVMDDGQQLETQPDLLAEVCGVKKRIVQCHIL